MDRPRFRVADLARAHHEDVRARHALDPSQHRALSAMAVCRTRALGGHVEVCDDCGEGVPTYNSCRNRHCPSCQGAAAREWVEARMARILPVPHFHAVFTLPAGLRPLFRQAREAMYDLLVRAAARSLEAVAARRLGVTLGITAVLHTWNQDVLFHPHVHCIVTGGGLAGDGAWKDALEGFLLPVRWLRSFFRGAVLREVRALWEAGELHPPGMGRRAFKRLLRDLWMRKTAHPDRADRSIVITWIGHRDHLDRSS